MVGLSSFTAAEAVTVALAVVLAVLLILIAYRAWKRSRTTPEERERQRRLWLVATGKMGDASLVEIRDDLVFYSYAVRGVEYTASQDVSRLTQRVPTDLSAMAAVSVKYDPRNPANSIVIAEEWTGLRASKAG
jgi:glutamine synthetase adenylyltransferase